jgi:signal transduction histidine kinase
MVQLFLILQLVCLAAVMGLHAGRARFTLAPAFGGCSILTFLTWQLLQTAWWVDFAGAHINAAIYGPMPAILAGLTLVYAMDGNRAARAYLLTMAVTAAVCLLFNEFLFQLSHELPISSLFRFPLSMHIVLAVSLLAAGMAEVVVYELARRRLTVPIAMSVALLVGTLSFLVVQSLLSYGPETGLRNIGNQLRAVGLASILPAIAVAAYGALAQRAGLVLPARRPSELFSVWHRTELELAEVREGFLKARETIAELRALNRVVETERRLRAHQVERSPLAIFEIDHRGRIAKCNDAARALLGLGIPEGVQAGQLLPGFAALVADPTRGSAVLSLPSSPGTPARRIQVTAMPLGQRDYGPAYSVIAEDVTDREQLAFARSIAERVRGIHMTGRVIGHDLSNLMLAIDGNLARLRDRIGATASDEVAQSLRAIAEAAQRSRDMMRELGTQQPFALPELNACDLHALAEQAVSFLAPRAADAGIALRIEGPSGVTVAADRTQMVRVLLNLLGNAIRACRPGGKIEIETGADAEGAFVRVRDDGIGMTADQLARAFDPGFSTKAGGQGGLGLAISYLIVDAHGGRLTLSSEPGAGTVATVRLPVSTLRVLPADARPVLLIMDDEQARERCASLYRDLGGEVVEVASAEELADLLEEDPADWELVVRTPHPNLKRDLRRRLSGSAEMLVGKTRWVQRGMEKCRLSQELTRELAAQAQPAARQEYDLNHSQS